VRRGCGSGRRRSSSSIQGQKIKLQVPPSTKPARRAVLVWELTTCREKGSAMGVRLGYMRVPVNQRETRGEVVRTELSVEAGELGIMPGGANRRSREGDLSLDQPSRGAEMNCNIHPIVNRPEMPTAAGLLQLG
jgi:hypothetical protein